jgi:hypothetical protein
MSLRLKYLDILSGLGPAGALGVSLLLGSAAPCGANDHPLNSLPAATQGVSKRLAAIREAVSELGSLTIRSGEGEQRLAWGNWWRNGGWHNGGWGNWRNGWHNGWPNWWHNW